MKYLPLLFLLLPLSAACQADADITPYRQPAAELAALEAMAKGDSIAWSRALGYEDEPAVRVDTLRCLWLTYAGDDGLVHYAENVRVETISQGPRTISKRPLGLPGCRRILTLYLSRSLTPVKR